MKLRFIFCGALAIGVIVFALPWETSGSPPDKSLKPRGVSERVSHSIVVPGEIGRNPQLVNSLEATSEEVNVEVWQDCFLENNARDCLLGRLDSSVNPEDLANAIQNSSLTNQEIVEIILLMLEHVDPTEGLEYLDTLYQFLGENIGSEYLIESVIRELQIKNHGWLDGFMDSLVSSKVYSTEATDLSILLTSHFAEEDSFFWDLLEEGASGAWGGTTAQVERSIAVVSYLYAKNGETTGSLEFLLATIEGSSIRDYPGAGGVLTSFLLAPNSMTPETAPRAWAGIAQMLGDPTFRDSSTAYLLVMGIDEVLVSCPLGLKTEIFENVEASARRQGLEAYLP